MWRLDLNQSKAVTFLKLMSSISYYLDYLVLVLDKPQIIRQTISNLFLNY